MFLAKVTVFCFAILTQYKSAQSACSVSITSFTNILPVSFKQETILYPDQIGNFIKTENGDSIYLACPGNKIVLKKKKQVQLYELTEFKCTKDDKYVNTDPKFKKYDIDDLTCDELQPIEKLEPVTGICDENNNLKRMLIGFQFYDKKKFISHIEVCWDDQKKTALYAKATISSIPSEWKTNADRPFFRPDKLFEKALEKHYTKHFQMFNLCNSFESIPDFIKDDIVEKSLLEKGHLVAKADFPFDAQQRLTFQYTNVAPQWGIFNRENWKQVEEQIRKYVVTNKKDLIVYTGTAGIFKMVDRDYYLYETKPQSQIPVPKYFWKIVLKQTGPTNYLGVGILGLNDIFATKVTAPCKNMITYTTWLNKFQWSNTKLGYVIACEIREFVKISELREVMSTVVPTLPATPDKISLLL